MNQALCVLLLLAAAAHAQTTSGRIAGLVADGSRAALPNASITAENTGTGAKLKTASNAEGRYVLFPLPPGEYSLTIEASGFQPLRVEAIRVDVAATLQRDFVLDVARLESAVTVSADSAPLLSATASIESTIVREQIDTLPLNGRDFNQFAMLAAGFVMPGISIPKVHSCFERGRRAAWFGSKCCLAIPFAAPTRVGSRGGKHKRG